MREIKFRAWGKNIQSMFYSQAVGLGSFFKDLESDAQEFSEQWQIMQYTGLKDKNGVEIYEGDIFNLDDDMAPAVIEYTNRMDETYNSAEFCFALYEDGKCFQRLSLDEFYIDKSEVVGNVYENPDLLQDSV